MRIHAPGRVHRSLTHNKTSTRKASPETNPCAYPLPYHVNCGPSKGCGGPKLFTTLYRRRRCQRAYAPPAKHTSVGADACTDTREQNVDTRPNKQHMREASPEASRRGYALAYHITYAPSKSCGGPKLCWHTIWKQALSKGIHAPEKHMPVDADICTGTSVQSVDTRSNNVSENHPQKASAGRARWLNA